MVKLYKGVYFEGSTVRISVRMASHYVPQAVLEYLPCFGKYYYCREELVMFFCPMLAVKLIDTENSEDTCASKLESLHIYLGYVLLSMKHSYSHFMFSDETASFKKFQGWCSESLFSSQTSIDDYFM